jgi:hypothetical protein
VRRSLHLYSLRSFLSSPKTAVKGVMGARNIQPLAINLLQATRAEQIRERTKSIVLYQDLERMRRNGITYRDLRVMYETAGVHIEQVDEEKGIIICRGTDELPSQKVSKMLSEEDARQLEEFKKKHGGKDPSELLLVSPAGPYRKEIEFYVATAEGAEVSLYDLFLQEGVDKYRTFTNSIHQTYEVLGIEAARSLFIEELSALFSADIDPSHILLLADLVFNRGVPLGVTHAYNVIRTRNFVTNAAFERAPQVLMEGAVAGKKGSAANVAHAVVLGQRPAIGTGFIGRNMTSGTDIFIGSKEEESLLNPPTEGAPVDYNINLEDDLAQAEVELYNSDLTDFDFDFIVPDVSLDFNIDETILDEEVPFVSTPIQQDIEIEASPTLEVPPPLIPTTSASLMGVISGSEVRRSEPLPTPAPVHIPQAFAPFVQYEEEAEVERESILPTPTHSAPVFEERPPVPSDRPARVVPANIEEYRRSRELIPDVIVARIARDWLIGRSAGV